MDLPRRNNQPVGILDALASPVDRHCNWGDQDKIAVGRFLQLCRPPISVASDHAPIFEIASEVEVKISSGSESVVPGGLLDDGRGKLEANP